jgi:GrpB-like predicted nucleotidyltransferase (UPF0157 family)
MSSVVISAYMPAWPAHFEAVRDGLLAVFAGDDVAIEHIGSTAVPGLSAKPVIDVLLGAPSLAPVEARIDALARAGYTYRPAYEQQVPERRYFVCAAPPAMPVHLHAVARGGRLWRNHLCFRDALRADPALRADYQALKRRLARDHAQDKARYTAAKAPFIARVLAQCAAKMP